jgi:hypothetical protein
MISQVGSSPSRPMFSSFMVIDMPSPLLAAMSSPLE